MKRVTLAILAIAVACASVAIAGALWWQRHLSSASVYTDADLIRAPARAAPLRDILWQPARPVTELDALDNDDYEPRFSADEQSIFFVRNRAGENADIYVAHRTLGAWTEPQPVAPINTEHDELGPEPSRDGSALYFYSDRPGGFGEYDIWVSTRSGDEWSPPVNLGSQINSPHNDYAPALAPDASSLCFASNRPKPGETDDDQSHWPATIREDVARRDYDLYSAPLTLQGFGTATPIDTLNTAANEGAPAFSPIGDFLYFASDRPTGRGGFDLYRTRRLRGDLTPPDNLGDAINSASNDLDPALSMGGFSLHFSSDRASRAAHSDARPVYDLYVSTSREVFREVDPALASIDWLALWHKLWPLLLALLLLLLLLLLLIRFAKDQSLQDRFRKLSLLAKCLLLSLLIHMLLLSLLAVWQVGSSLGEYLRGASERRVALISGTSSSAIAIQVRSALTDLDLPEPLVAEAQRPSTARLDLDTPNPSFDAARATIAPSSVDQPFEASEARVDPESVVADATLIEQARAIDVAPLESARLPRTAEPALEDVRPSDSRPMPDAPSFEPALAHAAESALAPERTSSASIDAPHPLPTHSDALAHVAESLATILPPAQATVSFLQPELEQPTPARHAEAEIETPPSHTPSAPAPTFEPRSLAADSHAIDPSAIAPAASEAAPIPIPAVVDAASPAPSAPREPAFLETRVSGAEFHVALEESPPIRQDEPDASLSATPIAAGAAPPTLQPMARADSSQSPNPEAAQQVAAQPISMPVEPEVSSPASVDTGAQPRLDSAPFTALAALPEASSRQRAESEPLATLPSSSPSALAPSPGTIEASRPDAVLDPRRAAPGSLALSPTSVPPLEESRPPAFAGESIPSRTIDPPTVDLSLPQASLASGAEEDAPGAPAPNVQSDAALPRLAQVDMPPAPTPHDPSALSIHAIGEAPLTVDMEIPSDTSIDRTLTDPEPVPALDVVADLNLMLPDASDISANPFPQRAPDTREQLVEEHGGSEETERAVSLALEWLASRQSRDGRWTGRGPEHADPSMLNPAQYAFDSALTGLALLCFLGADHTHVAEGPYKDCIDDALQWLLDLQSADGDLRAGETMYSHAIAAIALCEALAMTGDPRLLDPCERAVEFILQARNTTVGGWRYEPGQPGDTSVLGWQIMALRSAERAGIEVPAEAFEAASQWLDMVSRGDGFYAYRPGQRPTHPMTAEGMFVQQLVGLDREHPRMQQSAAAVLERLPDWRRDANTSAWYYATLALFQHQGEPWRRWNDALIGQLVENQLQDGAERGSWTPSDQWSRIGGRIYQTALCTLSLEIYYRYLPHYLEPQVNSP